MSAKTTGEIEFNDQAFLWDFLHLFQNKAKAGAPGKFQYKNFLQIEDKNSIATVNKLTGVGVESLGDFNTAELSAIEPYCILWQQIKKSTRGAIRVPFPFSDVTHLRSITNPTLSGRGTDVGLKSVDWKDTGVNPANVGISFKGEMVLHFQNFEGIFAPRMSNGYKIRFSELLDLGESLGMWDAQSGITGNPTNNCTETSIRLEVGWKIARGSDAGKHSDSAIAKRLESLKRIYVIVPARQEMSIGENGTVDLRIDFWARLEGYAMGSAGDLLYINEGAANIQSLRNKAEGARRAYAQELGAGHAARHPSQADIDAEIALEVKMEAGVHGNQNLGRAAMTKRVVARYAAKAKAAEAKAQKILDDAIAAEAEIRSISYRRIFEILQRGIGKRSRLFYIDIDPAIESLYIRLLLAGSESVRLMKERQKRGGDRSDIKSELVRISQTYKAERIAITKQITTTLTKGKVGTSGDLQAWLPPDLVKSNKKANQAATSNTFQGKPEPIAGTHRLHFFFLGDLLEAIMEIIYERPTINSTGGRGRSTSVCNVIKDIIRLIAGPFTFYDVGKGRNVSIDLADVPIAKSLFNSWYIDHVVRKKREHYPLRAFIRDLCSHLLNNAFSPGRVGVLAGARNIRTVAQTVWLPKNNLMDKRFKSGTKTRVNISRTLASQQAIGSDVQEWLFLYVIGNTTEALNGKFIEDKQMNIPHFFIGNDLGILKKIDFTRTKIPYKLEASLSKANEPIKNNLLYADRYDANLTIVGNPTLKPGMLIYVDPKGFGLGINNAIDRDRWRADLGVGGYFRIVDVSNSFSAGKFETKLRVISELSTRELQARRP